MVSFIIILFSDDDDYKVDQKDIGRLSSSPSQEFVLYTTAYNQGTLDT